MGRHYDDYVVTDHTLGLPAIVGIPVAHPYERLTGKIRAAGVTGNIGDPSTSGQLFQNLQGCALKVS